MVDCMMPNSNARSIQHLLLVGGYGESPVLQNRIKFTVKGNKCEVTLLDEGA